MKKWQKKFEGKKMKNTASNPILFYNFNYIDPVSNSIRSEMEMLVTGEIVQSIGTKVTKPTNCKEIDLHGQWILPGLIDVHCHLSGSGKKLPKFLGNDNLVKFIQKRRIFQKIIYNTMKKNAMTALMSGTTTVRTLGDAHLCVLDLRDNINSGREKGARIFSGGKAIALRGCHGAALCLDISNIDESREITQFLINQGVDCLKVMATGGVTGAKTIDEAGRPELSIEVMKAICDLAHRHNLKVTAHCESTEGARNCVQSGFDSLEHGSDYDEDLLYKLEERQIAIIPTLGAGFAYGGHSRKETGLSEIELINEKRINKNIKIGLKRAISHGNILIGAGDDAGIPLVLHGKIAQEIKMLNEEFGLTPMKSIKCATINNAKIMGREDKLGSLDIGKFADFIVFAPERNPLKNLDFLFNPDSVYQSGLKIR